MPDNLSRAKRSKIMASIKGKDTRPELVIRRLLWAQGKRYRTHDGRVLGRPDISNSRKRLAVFIDGCFWHGCKKCYREPTTNPEFWRRKLEYNLQRRKQVVGELNKGGWTVLEFWEHDVLRSPSAVASRIASHL